MQRERRKFERKPARANAIVHCHGRFQSVKVVDYSAGGVQLDGTFGLFRNDSVELEFMCGTRVPGRVAWSLGQRTGIAFAEPLPANHRVLVQMASSDLSIAER